MELDSIWPRSDPRIWYELPVSMLIRYREQAPRYFARETLRMVQAVALGSGSIKRGVMTAMLRKLERQAQGPRRAPARTAKTFEEAQAIYAGMGIGVYRAEPTRDNEVTEPE